MVAPGASLGSVDRKKITSPRQRAKELFARFPSRISVTRLLPSCLLHNHDDGMHSGRLFGALRRRPIISAASIQEPTKWPPAQSSAADCGFARSSFSSTSAQPLKPQPQPNLPRSPLRTRARPPQLHLPRPQRTRAHPPTSSSCPARTLTVPASFPAPT
jgi:hypothetical protein